MNRVNGYIVLDDFLDKEEVATEEFQSSIKSVKKGKLRFWLELDDGQRVFFKLCGGNEFNELVVEEILKELRIPCAHYDLAMFNGIKGVISYDYKKDGVKYTKGHTILLEYYDYLEANNKFKDLLPGEKISFEEDELLRPYNRLDIIWDALYYHFKDKENVYEIVKELMQEIVIKRNVDLLLCNDDDHPFNWEIMEDGENISLNVYYDNTRYFENDKLLLQTSYGNYNTIKEDLEEYFRVSSEENVFEFIKLYEKINGALLGKCINKAMLRTEFKPQEEKIKSIFNIFNENRKVIGEVIAKYQENRKIGDKNGH